VRRSRNRGCKGHRILRRVLVGGRHLRLSRAILLHGWVVTAALAASSRGKAIRLARAKATKDARRRSGSRGRGRGDRGVRGSIGQQAPWDENAHARNRRPGDIRNVDSRQGSACPLQSAEASSSVVKHSVPWSSPHGAQDSVGYPRDESRGGAKNARGTGTRRSFRWQKLVGRIARLVLRKIARSCGEPGR
jgi:hypothetical protein